MSEINDLRERVEAAEQRFGLMDEQQRHYSERVIGLIETIEAQLADARGEIEKQIAENQRLTQENEELRTMLHSVLRSIEEKTFTQTLQNLESRVSALVSHAGTAAAAPAQAAADENRPEVAESDASQALIIEADTAAEAPGADAQPDMEAAFEDDGSGVEAVVGEDTGMPDAPEEAVAAGAEMPDSVAFEDADPDEIAAEAEAEADETEAPEMETPEPETQEDDAAEAAAIADESEAAFTEAPSDDETPSDGEAQDDPTAADGAEGEDIFAAMNLLNADDEDFAAAAQGAAPIDDDVSIHEAAGAESDFTAPEMAADDAPEIQSDTAAEADPVAESDLSDAVAERLAGEVPEELAENVAPTVKEIIRRVGDLARELERAESARRSSHSDEHPAEAEGGDHPGLDQAANA